MHPLLIAIQQLPGQKWAKLRRRRLRDDELEERDGVLVAVNAETGVVRPVSQAKLDRLAEIVAESLASRALNAANKNAMIVAGVNVHRLVEVARNVVAIHAQSKQARNLESIRDATKMLHEAIDELRAVVSGKD